MREIEFRGRRLDNKEWAYGCYAEFINYLDGNSKPGIQIIRQVPSDYDRMIPAFETELVEVDPATVGQYTGLSDKNGRKIYEGDIVKIIDAFVSDDTFAVYWIHDGDIGCGFALPNCFTYEIIGNIHDGGAT